MRALAVLSVVLYHADVAALPGGFLGVELFFVVSGFLITSLLQSEYAVSGDIQWLGFWKRRARRLFPALWAVLLLVPAYAALRLPEELWGLRDDVLAALVYVTNWQLILADQSYFEQIGRPSLLQHLWSLAVEEQFYVVWPMLFSLLLAKLSRRRAAQGLLAACAASAGLMWLLYDPAQDPSRVYYGSDTRAFGLLMGAALAFALPAATPNKRGAPARNDTILSALALAALGYAFVALDELSPFVYPFGLLGVGVATCALIAASLRAPAGPVARLLSSRALVEVGKRSYSLYLWHWPVVAATRPDVDVSLHGFSLLLLRLGSTALLAEVSYRWVETPLRRGEWSLRWPSGSPSPLRLRLYATAFGTLLLTLFSTRALIAAQAPLTEDLTLAAPSQTALQAAAGPTVTQLSAGDVARAQPHVLAIGDSVMLGARKFLRSEAAQVEVDAEVGRTPLTTLSLLKRRKSGGALGDVVIIHLGNNGPFQPEQFDRMMDLLQDVPRVVFVTAKVPRRLGVFNNRTIRDGVERHPRTALVDWFEVAKDHANWFRDDGLHLRESGATEYARLLAQHYLPAPAPTLPTLLPSTR